MILIGRFRSPFVRRTAVVLKTLGVDFESKGLTMADNAAEITALNPVGRVPSLVLGHGEVLVDSAAIIDYVLESADPENRLLAPSGSDRRAVLKIAAIAHSAMEKAVASAYERKRRPEEKIFQVGVDHVEGQITSALRAFDDIASAASEWLHGDHMTLADKNAVVAYDQVGMAEPYLVEDGAYPALGTLSARCNELPAFAETRWKG